MNPIALKHGRTVYAYACGRCHHIGYTGGVALGFAREEIASEIKRAAQWSYTEAEVCCRCDTCKAAVLPYGTRMGAGSSCDVVERAKRAEADAKAAARVAALEAHNAAAMARAGGAESAACELLTLMEDANRFYYHGTWPVDAEFILWGEAHDPGELPTDEANAMARLAERARGWWRWSDEFGDPVFVPMAEWLAMVETRSASGG